MLTLKLKILPLFSLHIIDIIDKIDKSSSVPKNNCKFVWTNYMGLAADSKIQLIVLSLKYHDIEMNKEK